MHIKTPVLKSLLNKAAGPKACKFIKKWLQHRCFPVNIAKFLRTPILKNIYVRLLLSDFRKWLFRTFFLNSRFQNHPDLKILKMYQPLSNQSFNHNLAHMLFLNLTPKLSFEPWFRICLSLLVTTGKANACSPWTS